MKIFFFSNSNIYSSINLCFFGVRIVVGGVVDDEDDAAIADDIVANVDDACCVDGCNGRRVRFLVEILLWWTRKRPKKININLSFIYFIYSFYLSVNHLIFHRFAFHE